MSLLGAATKAAGKARGAATKGSGGKAAKKASGKRAPVDRVIGILSRKGLRQGLLGGDRAWLIIWVVALVLGRSRRKDAETVYSGTLDPGHALVVVNGPAGVGAGEGNGGGRRRK
ncbi:MAG: hypothetical protein ACRDZY_06210 [Acidimicrobiales bacterium]